ncbi:unnamed protein product [Polarella glacialis]|uniref:Protein kinase domain-containing protein n=1 Tax=Polarella glacialis TaxID=89957 RepID=A0A813GFB4_POLGL|nr:unnamed protein product [Polarella glacialis]
MRLWLHPVHASKKKKQKGRGGEYVEPVAWRPTTETWSESQQSHQFSLDKLVRRAIHGLELSTDPVHHIELDWLIKTAFACPLLMHADASFNVTVGSRHLSVSPTRTSKQALLTQLPLASSDIMWAACLSANSDDSGQGAASAQYILAILPTGRSPELDQRKCFEKAWLVCVGGCTGAAFRDLLSELGLRGAIRWDLHDNYELDEATRPPGVVSAGRGFQAVARSLIPPRSSASSEESADGNIELQLMKETGAKGNRWRTRETPGPSPSSEGSVSFGIKRVVQAPKQVKLCEQVRREISFLAQFRGHPNITNFIGAFCYSEDLEVKHSEGAASSSSASGICPGAKVWSIITELYPKGDLHDYIWDRGALGKAEGLQLFCGIASALAHLHAHQVMHRDVKADNILITEQGGAVLADFGLAAHIDDEVAMQEHKGTPGYAAPEVVCAQSYGLKADVFSAGVVFYFVFSGQLPFPGPGTHCNCNKAPEPKCILTPASMVCQETCLGCFMACFRKTHNTALQADRQKTWLPEIVHRKEPQGGLPMFGTAVVRNADTRVLSGLLSGGSQSVEMWSHSVEPRMKASEEKEDEKWNPLEPDKTFTPQSGDKVTPQETDKARQLWWSQSAEQIASVGGSMLLAPQAQQSDLQQGASFSKMSVTLPLSPMQCKTAMCYGIAQETVIWLADGNGRHASTSEGHELHNCNVFYHEHRPEKLTERDFIDFICSVYEGREAELDEALRQKYGTGLRLPSGAPPQLAQAALSAAALAQAADLASRQRAAAAVASAPLGLGVAGFQAPMLEPAYAGLQEAWLAQAAASAPAAAAAAAAASAATAAASAAAVARAQAAQKSAQLAEQRAMQWMHQNAAELYPALPFLPFPVAGALHDDTVKDYSEGPDFSWIDQIVGGEEASEEVQKRREAQAASPDRRMVRVR